MSIPIVTDFSIEASINDWIKRLLELKEEYGGETSIKITILENYDRVNTYFQKPRSPINNGFIA